uniref:peptidylprolyl isomerase n=1 Tax=Rhizophora mucronata TaxID=61149 RepID=A0A2P2L1Y0_RHIMU
MSLLTLKSSSLESEIQNRNSGFPRRKIGFQGLKKQIIKKGISWQTPSPGDEVEVHFSGRIIGGACLDSTRDKGATFRFKLGQGEVIKGWDEGVVTMKKGERAIFTVPPILAYGEAGSSPLIPPNATLTFDIELLSWSSIRDLTGDGGILKKVVKDGEGWAAPRDGDEVFVKYEARLENGTLVSKSDNGVEFHVGDGHLCPALGKAVKTMRRGEIAELAVKFSYGFNQNGNGSTKTDCGIPPDSNLTIKLELVWWRSVVDVVGDKTVLKKIIKAGEGYDRPNEGSHAKVVYVGKLEEGTIFERKGTNEEPFAFVTLEEHVNEGLDRAIMTMKKGEHALVTTSADYICSSINSEQLLPNSRVHYEVEMVDFVKEKSFWEMGAKEKLEACEMKKLDGNVLFKAGKFWRASRKYEKAAKYAEFDHYFTNEEKCLANALRLSCSLNNAACKLKLGEHREASKLCTKVFPFHTHLHARTQTNADNIRESGA